MYTVIETPVYSKMVDKILTESERDSFAAFIASNPQAGSVARGSGGIRKVRWAQQGRGKSGGARIIYYNKSGLGQWRDLVVNNLCERRSIDNSVP
jgi:mRNA-degrading endonuclease RelE of RelBE toxin-antitoxin system